MARLSQQEIQLALDEEDQIEIELARLEGDDNPDWEDPNRDWEEFCASSGEGEKAEVYSQDDSEYYFSKSYDDPYLDIGYDDDFEDLYFLRFQDPVPTSSQVP